LCSPVLPCERCHHMEAWIDQQIRFVEHHLAVLQIELRRHHLGGHRRWGPGHPLHVTHLAEVGAWLFLLHLACSSSFAAVHLAQALRRLLWLSLRQAPLAAAIGLAFYVKRVLRSRSLQQEWCDFVGQWQLRRSAMRCWTGRAVEGTTCVICAECLPQTPWHFSVLSCCGVSLCWHCVRRHAESVVDDARPEMLCPFLPCRKILPDIVVQTAIRREQWSWWSLDVTGNLARRKKRAYLRWALSCGLAASCSARAEDVVHCPSDNCGYMWLLPQSQRRRKVQIEPQSRWNPKSWAISRKAGLYAAPLDSGGVDERHLQCAKCRLEFCLLCTRPWNVIGSKGCHAEKSCMEHSAEFRESGDSGSWKWAGAKPCPGCASRIIRSMGCNHMTCTQCGSQWCWVCSADWSPKHYGCLNAAGNQDCGIL